VRLAQTQTDTGGKFTVSVDQTPNGMPMLYLTASGGIPAANTAGGTGSGLDLLAVLGPTPPAKVVVNELTTVASAFTNARFIKSEAISGNPLGLKIAAGNVPNLVNPTTGTWGKVLLDPLNSTQTVTLATLDTLGSLITAFATVANDDWRARFLKATTPAGGAAPQNTLEAVAGIAREPWADPKTLFALFEEAYPQPKDGARRAAPFVPYLAWTPPDFALSLSFAGGGIYSAGRLMFDADGNLWSGQNWMPGSQSGVIRSIGGGVVKITPNGAPLSPPITGFTGMGIDGVGWGTAVTRDKVWITSFNGNILVMDFDGHPIGSESDFPFKEKLTGLEGQANGVIASLTEGVRYLLYNSVEDRQIPEKPKIFTAIHLGLTFLGMCNIQPLCIRMLGRCGRAGCWPDGSIFRLALLNDILASCALCSLVRPAGSAALLLPACVPLATRSSASIQHQGPTRISLVR
jgi:hypothetical protein